MTFVPNVQPSVQSLQVQQQILQHELEALQQDLSQLQKAEKTFTAYRSKMEWRVRGGRLFWCLLLLQLPLALLLHFTTDQCNGEGFLSFSLCGLLWWVHSWNLGGVLYLLMHRVAPYFADDIGNAPHMDAIAEELQVSLDSLTQKLADAHQLLAQVTAVLEGL
mmetsp:Transcript_46606/g.116106  ORF Transcript_46606/g.116106 Transcript_46606/m.116106 type:complete len:163 (+) Transcript_46606:148-636(+)